MRLTLLLALAALPAAADLPAGLPEAIDRVAHFDYAEPTAPLHTLAHYTPKAAGDPAARTELAAALARAATGAGTTARGRTLLCLQLALVIGEAERPALEKLLADPATAADAAIALAPLRGGTVPAPHTPKTEAACLALAASASPAERIAGLSLLARDHRDAAAAPATKAMDDADEAVAATAIRVVAACAPTSLVARLTALPPARQVIALQALADAGTREAAGPARALLASERLEVAREAARTLGTVGGNDDLPALGASVETRPDLAAVVAEVLGTMTADGVDAAILAAIPASGPAYRTCLIQAAAARGTEGLDALLLREAGSTNAAVRAAALKSLARLSSAAAYSGLVDLLAASPDAAVEGAVGAMGRRLPAGTSRSAPLIALLQRDGAGADTRAAAMRLLAAAAEPDGLKAVAALANASEPAFRALCAWADPEALPALAAGTEKTTNETLRVLGLRGVLRLCAGRPDALTWLTRMRPVLRTADDRRAFLATLPESGGAAALALATPFTNDPAVRAEAEAMVERIGATMPPEPLRRAAIAAALPAGARLCGYLDCGTARENATSDAVRVQDGGAQHFRWESARDPAARAAATVAYADPRVSIGLSGLNPARRYAVGFTWWDGDAKGRTMSAWAGGQPLAAARELPRGPGPAPGAQTMVAPLPAEACSGGRVELEFRREAGVNAAVGEVWVIEQAAAAGAEVRANAGAQKKILIVTGLDYPGHHWRETTPVLTAHLAKDPRLEVSVTEDARFLGSPDLARYDAIVLHYMNWQDPGPGAAAQENLRKMLDAGTGMVLVHFACGAFQGWPEFVKMAGRVWDPKKRGHDPYGAFTVRIADAEHPVTHGLKDFATTDELYTCLTGDTPVRMLADAVSKGDHQPYPMAFALEYGKGRVFLSTLGHDVKAFNDDAGRLYRRAAAWAAGLAPQE